MAPAVLLFGAGRTNGASRVAVTRPPAPLGPALNHAADRSAKPGRPVMNRDGEAWNVRPRIGFAAPGA